MSKPTRPVEIDPEMNDRTPLLINGNNISSGITSTITIPGINKASIIGGVTNASSALAGTAAAAATKDSLTTQRKLVAKQSRPRRAISNFRKKGRDNLGGRIGVHIRVDEIDIAKLAEVVTKRLNDHNCKFEYFSNTAEWHAIDLYDVMRVWQIPQGSYDYYPTSDDENGGYSRYNHHQLQHFSTSPEIYVFSFGAVVFWNFSSEKQELEFLEKYIILKGTTADSKNDNNNNNTDTTATFDKSKTNGSSNNDTDTHATSSSSEKSKSDDDPNGIIGTDHPIAAAENAQDEMAYQFIIHSSSPSTVSNNNNNNNNNNNMNSAENDFDRKKFSIKRDVAFLTTFESGERLAVSFALAKSSLLSIYEWQVQRTIERNSHIPEEMAENGCIRMHQRDITKEVGKMFLVKHGINLDCSLIDTPEEFWEDDRFEAVYNMALKYFEIDKRLTLVNNRLTMIGELHQVLIEEAQNYHAAVLEWIVIILIVVEVVLDLLHLTY